MSVKETNNKIFYIKAFLISFGIISVVYSFMLLQFWWGNHDWDYLKNGIFLKDGLFEARYSQHLPTVLFFEGQILPPIIFIVTLALLTSLGLIIAKYLQIPQKTHYYILFTLCIAIQPHTPILFYYVFITLPLIFWGCFGTSLLFLSQKPLKLWKFILGTLVFFFLLGSYPPILVLPLTLFIGKRIQKYISAKENLKEITYKTLFYVSQLFLAGILYKLIILHLTKTGEVYVLMYNTSIKNLKNIFLSSLTEPLTYFTRINEFYQTLGIYYILLFYIPLIAAIIIIFRRAKNKLLAFLLIFALILASRLPFLLSDNAYLASFRINWWGQTSLIAFSLSMILQTQKTWLKNIIFAFFVFFIFIFIRIDFAIQKTQYLAFHSERLFQKRVEEQLFSLPKFNINKKYATLNLGYPDFHHHFCRPNCDGFDNELLNATVLPTDFGHNIFWDEIKNPIVLKYGYWNLDLWIVIDKYTLYKFLLHTPEEITKLRHWMYFSAQQYPHQNAIYIGTSLIMFNFDNFLLNKNKETIIYLLNTYKQNRSTMKQNSFGNIFIKE